MTLTKYLFVGVLTVGVVELFPGPVGVEVELQLGTIMGTETAMKNNMTPIAIFLNIGPP
jgi:hypothetical protein